MLATSKQPINTLIDTTVSIEKCSNDLINLNLDMADNINNNNTNTTAFSVSKQLDHITNSTASNFNKNINSPDYNYYLNYSLDSPLTTDSSTTPFSNNETTTSSNNNNNNTGDKKTKLDSIENVSFSTNNQISGLPDSNDPYSINNPSIRSSPSFSSSTTKLNTANNSTTNLSKLNFRPNFNNNNSTTTNPLDQITSNLNFDNDLVSNFENNKNNSVDPSNISNIDGSTLTNNSPINNLASPSVMNDLLELLDAKETEKKQQNRSVSPLQSINNNILNTTNIATSINTNNNNNNKNTLSFLDNSSPLTSQYNTENDFMQLDDVFENDIFPIDRRTSVVVNNKLPSLTNTRNSISHNVDFWNMDSTKTQGIGLNSMDVGPIDTEFSNNVLNITDNNNYDSNSVPVQSIDENVTQMLSDYNLDFSKENIGKSNDIINDTSNTNTNTTTESSNVMATNFNGLLYSPKQDSKHKQRTSVPLISESLYSPLYENSTMNSNNILLSTLNNDDFNITSFQNNLFDNDTNINGNDASIINNNNNNNILSTSEEQEIDRDTIINNSVNEFLNQLNDTSTEQKFIKPSMMLSENASLAAKLAVKGIPKVDTFPTIDTQQYNHPTRITKRKSVSSMASSGSNIHKHAYTNTRRKSTIGVVRSSTTMTPNGSVSSASTKKNNFNSPKSGSHSTDPENIEEKPFRCAECPKAFKRSEHLKRHIRSVHSNERPFPCTLCEKKFSRSDNLAQHLKTHKRHGDF